MFKVLENALQLNAFQLNTGSAQAWHAQCAQYHALCGNAFRPEVDRTCNSTHLSHNGWLIGGPDSVVIMNVLFVLPQGIPSLSPPGPAALPGSKPASK